MCWTATATTVTEMPDASGAAAAAQATAHLVLVDGSGYIFRAYHALPPMVRADGTPVNAVFGFTNMLAQLLQSHEGTHLAVIFDAGRTTFRNELYSDYKAHRPDPPDELVPQFALIRDATAAFGVPAIELATWEADDLIASYARAATAAGWRTTIVSSDKDLMQLIDEQVVMQDPIKRKQIGAAEVMEKFGVPPAQVVEVQALMGDSVDNVPGVPGIGPKTASQLIQEFGTVEAVLAAAPAMKPSKRRDMLIAHADAARISRKLVELSCDVPLPTPIEELAVREPDRPNLIAWLHAMGFKSTATRLGLEGVARAPSPEPAEYAVEPEQPAFGPYEVVTDLARLGEWAAEAQARGTVALAAVADGARTMQAIPVGLALATGPNRACYIPLGHVAAGSTGQLALAEPAAEVPAPPPQLDVAAVAEVLAPMLHDSGTLKVMHEAKDGLMLLGRAGMTDVAPLDCTMLISYAQGTGAHGHGLEETSFRNLGHKPASLDSVTGTGRARLPLAQVPPERAAAYAAERADVALRLWHTLRPRLRVAKSLVVYEEMERRLVPVLLGMEAAGIKVDEAELRRMSADFAARMAVMETEIHAMAGKPFNLGSPKVLGEILFDEMKLPGAKRMAASGTWSTDASVLQTLADAGHELPARILDWRQLNKLRNTYTEALVAEINPQTGRVHTNYAQAIASTGRLSSNDPNLQNIPIRTEEGARIRQAFIAESGHVLVSCDYSQIELRLLAHMADIPPLREAFMTGQDIHARTASEVFGVPMAAMDGATRRRAKAINFGIIYGISAFGLARQLQIDPAEARVYIEAYFQRYPGIRAFMERTKEEARIQGYVLTPFGRRCWVPGITEKAAQKRAYAERQAINAPLQGGAADIIKRAMVRVPAALAAAGLTSRLLLQVHDELLFEAPEAEAAATAEIGKRVMEAAVTISVPLVVETGIGANWGAAH